tara:strand:- start:626 stop:799 length:174 start_codon:yes stop_codon:yes gene_type:complete
MSKIAALIAIPIAFFGVKRLQEEFPDEKPEDIKPLIPEPTDVPARPRQRDDGTFFGL